MVVAVFDTDLVQTSFLGRCLIGKLKNRYAIFPYHVLHWVF